MKLILLPHQLFEVDYLKDTTNDLDKINEIILYEHPQYFMKYNFNKKKLVLHRASMKYYEDYLKTKLKSKIKKITYHEYKDSFDINKQKDVVMFDPIDKIKLSKKIKILETPNFLLTKEDYLNYQKKSKSFFFNGFYMSGKKVIDIIPTIKSQDKENRKKLPKGLNIPPLPTNKGKKDSTYIKEAIAYVEKHFPNNYGNTDNFQFPISHTTAHKWFKKFLETKLNKFGDYEDFIKQGENYMFHSCLSSSINIGLIQPSQIIDELRKLKSKYKINNYEGYIRQLFWREYQRYCYLYFNFKGKNYFGNKKKLSKGWYDGTLGVKPVDDAIKSGFDTGYLHHIIRLMVVGNYMNLSGISPNEGFRWFMEFSCDSYEWVMMQNVLDMVFCVSGGKTMRKPYLSSSTYIMSMSDYKKGEWSEIWNKTYKDFMRKHKTILLRDFKYYFHFIKNY